MNLIEITRALHEEAKKNGSAFLGDYAGKYDISDEEAERIAAEANSIEEFESIWENHDWWASE